MRHITPADKTMAEMASPLSKAPKGWTLPDRGKVGMAGLIVAESAIFTIFIVAYLFYAGKSVAGPTPREVLVSPVFFTVCLLLSSLTIHSATHWLARNSVRIFFGYWILTIALGGLFLYGTGQEWHRLIYEDGLTVSSNLFGTTYYPLVGLHAFHVIVGLVMLSTVAVLTLSGHVDAQQSNRVGVLAMYWHFVDAVWVVVFIVVYVSGH